jgi:hypothetical protein
MRYSRYRLNLFMPAIVLTAFLIFTATAVHAYEGQCGTMRLIENLMNNRKQNHYYAQTALNTAETASAKGCQAKDFYDSVYTIETQHFQIFYVLNGPHATTKAYADSTAAIMESAWNFYINKRKMRTPKAPSTTHHYQQKVKDSLYPIEIIDINQIRNNIIIGNGCEENFGITYPIDDNGTSQIFMENDFKISCSYSQNKDTIFVHGDTCVYATASYALRNNVHNFSYDQEWVKGLHVTSFHEFYHAIQLSYISMFVNKSFWFEASATGFEEITNPDIDDYFRYIPSLFEYMGLSLSETFKNYGASTLFIYLYRKVSESLDKSIWENYSKNPDKNFEYQIQAALKELKLDADSVFHDYAVRLSFSGNRTAGVNKKYWINEDQPQWANARFLVTEKINPELKSLAFQFHRTPQNYIEPDFSNFVGKASIVVYNDDKATIYKIHNNKTLDSLSSILATCDSSSWIFSRLGDSESIPITNSNTAPHAFPVPWKEGTLCFAPLPRDKQFIEIRNRRGDLISQEKYDGTSHCLTEDNVRSMMAPGIYRFRVGNKGKTTSFIVLY